MRNAEAPSPALNFMNDLAVYIGQTAIDAVVGKGEVRGVDAEKVQNGGEEVMVIGATLASNSPLEPLAQPALMPAR